MTSGQLRMLEEAGNDAHHLQPDLMLGEKTTSRVIPAGPVALGECWEPATQVYGARTQTCRFFFFSPG